MYRRRRPVFRTNVFPPPDGRSSGYRRPRVRIRRVSPPVRPPSPTRCVAIFRVPVAVRCARRGGGVGGDLKPRERAGRGLPRRAPGRREPPGPWASFGPLAPLAVRPPGRPTASGRAPHSRRRRPAETARPSRRLGFPGDFSRPPGCPPLGRRFANRTVNARSSAAAVAAAAADAAVAAGPTWYV